MVKNKTFQKEEKMKTIIKEGYMPNFIGGCVAIFTMGFVTAMFLFKLGVMNV